MPVRKFDETKKREILDLAYAPGADKAVIAKENGITLSTLYGWRTDLKPKKATRPPSNGHQKAAKGPNSDFLALARAERARLQTQIEALDTLIANYRVP